MYVYMRTINVTFEDGKFKKLEKVKDQSGLNWHDLIMTLVDKKDKED